MVHRSPRTLASTLVSLWLLLAACAASSTAAPPVATAPPASVATTSPGSTTPGAAAGATAGTMACPTAALVGGALGLSLAAPVSVPGGSGPSLPAGATGVACDYRGTAANVIVELIANIDPAAISQFSSRFPVAFGTVPGVGDQARSFMQALGGGKDNEGVVATRGRTLVAITATATPASLAQVEALVASLL